MGLALYSTHFSRVCVGDSQINLKDSMTIYKLLQLKVDLNWVLKKAQNVIVNCGCIIFTFTSLASYFALLSLKINVQLN